MILSKSNLVIYSACNNEIFQWYVNELNKKILKIGSHDDIINDLILTR